MSGICAAWRKGNPGGASSLLPSLMAGLALTSSEQAAQEICGEAGIGVSARFATQQIYTDGQIAVACDAELFNENELSTSVGPTRRHAKTSDLAALMAALYERHGCDFVKKLRGGFSVLLWDNREKRLMAAIDG